MLLKLTQKITKFNLIEIREALRMYREDSGFEYIHENEIIEKLCKIFEEEGFQYELVILS